MRRGVYNVGRIVVEVVGFTNIAGRSFLITDTSAWDFIYKYLLKGNNVVKVKRGIDD